MPDRQQAKTSKFLVIKASFLADFSRFPSFGKAAMFLLSVVFQVTTLGKLFPHKQYKVVGYRSNAVMPYG